MAPLVWLITGCSSGIGKALAEAALARGEKVIATARAPVSRLDDLKAAGASTLELDVSVDKAQIEKVVEEAVKLYGRIDVVVPNAGYVEGAYLEVVTPDLFKAQFDVNFFGVTNLVGAVLPHLRKQRSGIVAFTNSVYSYSSMPGAAPYSASKHGVAAYAKTLAFELEPFNVKPICFDIGYIRTPVLDKMPMAVPENEDYKPMLEALGPLLESLIPNMPGSPQNCAEAIIKTVRDPNRKTMFVPLGSDALLTVREYAKSLLAACDEHEETAKGADLPGPKQGFFAQVPHYWNIPQSA